MPRSPPKRVATEPSDLVERWTDGIDASFAIDDCSFLRGSIRDRDQQMVRYWHAQARPLPVRVWNETRPSDCPIGPIALPDSSHK